jgi:hypothetical protein
VKLNDVTLTVGLLALLFTGCAKLSGTFSIAAPPGLHSTLPEAIAKVTGKSCFSYGKALLEQDDPAIERAVRDAISKAPGANALINASFEDQGECIIVTGWAVAK